MLCRQGFVEKDPRFHVDAPQERLELLAVNLLGCVGLGLTGLLLRKLKLRR